MDALYRLRTRGVTFRVNVAYRHICIHVYGYHSGEKCKFGAQFLLKLGLKMCWLKVNLVKSVEAAENHKSKDNQMRSQDVYIRPKALSLNTLRQIKLWLKLYFLKVDNNFCKITKNPSWHYWKDLIVSKAQWAVLFMLTKSKMSLLNTHNIKFQQRRKNWIYCILHMWPQIGLHTIY